ncbi:hypothetical protein NLX82_07805 [Paenibacillus sp. A3M_27_13]|nr:hypothetical protein [Paenibacillus sp. A3M_27_13]
MQKARPDIIKSGQPVKSHAWRLPALLHRSGAGVQPHGALIGRSGINRAAPSDLPFYSPHKVGV